jgi:hypothetical protein
MRGGTIGAFALVLGAGVGAMVLAVLVTAGVSASMSVRGAERALLWLGGGQLLAVATFVGAFAMLARRWAGATPPWWAQGALCLLLLAAAAMLFLFAMVAMNR